MGKRDRSLSLDSPEPVEGSKGQRAEWLKLFNESSLIHSSNFFLSIRVICEICGGEGFNLNNPQLGHLLFVSICEICGGEGFNLKNLLPRRGFICVHL